MLILNHLKSLEKHKGSVWSIRWSDSGSLIISCGTDGKVILWGPKSFHGVLKKKRKSSINQSLYSYWGQISFLQINKKLKSLRSLHFSSNTNEICLGTFSGICFLCKILFQKKKKISFLEIIEKLFGILPEIKSSCFSHDSIMISASGRDRTIWVWEKNLSREYQCLFVLNNHESDIKKIEWHPQNDTFLSSTYKGIIRGFRIKKSLFLNFFSLKISQASVWGLEFFENGDGFYACSSEGAVLNFSLIRLIINGDQKKIYFEDRVFFWLKKGDLTELDFSKINGIVLNCDEKGDLNLFRKKKIWGKKKKKIRIWEK